MNYYPNNDGDRFLAFPFLAGALVGGAAVGFSRPRPVFVSNPYPAYPSYPSYGYGYGAPMGMPYSNYSYNSSYSYANPYRY